MWRRKLAQSLAARAALVCLAMAPLAAQGLEIALAPGDFWEYLWTTESTDAVQGSVSVDVSTGRFMITLGAPVSIAGQQAFPLSVSGETSDGEVDFLPRWSHLAVGAGGSLLGSVDGSSLAPVFTTAFGSQSEGYLIEFPAEVPLDVSARSFEGLFNTFPATAVQRNVDPDGCTFYPSIGVEVCPNDDPRVTISEIEYFKDGLGAVGLIQFVNVTSSGGGFFTSFTDERTVELIGTNLQASDGSVVNPPPWNRRANLGLPRHRHDAAAMDGEIYVVGGLNADSEVLASVEIYDPVQDNWRAGPPLPSPQLAKVETAAGQLHVVTPSAPILILADTKDQWIEGPVTPFSQSNFDTCVIADRYVMAIAGTTSNNLTPYFFDTDVGQWFTGIDVNVTTILRFAVGCLGTDVIVSGGFRFGTLFSDPGTTDLVLRYEAVGGEWTFIESMNQRRESHVSTAFKGRLMVIGGSRSGELRDVEFLRSTGASWEESLPMFVPREDPAATVLDDRVWVIGGKLNGVVLDVVESLDAPQGIFSDGFE